MEQKIENKIATAILDQAFKVHSELGPGLLESVYENCLFYELTQAGYDVKAQVPVPMHYKASSLKQDLGLIYWWRTRFW